MPPAWRLLVTEPLDGPTNMAIDEGLLRARIAGEAPPTVRFFAWAPPTVSLGYGQLLDERIDLQACRRLGIGLVRRPTGGSAILHESPQREVTYSVVAAAGDFPGFDDVLETYRILGHGLAAGLARLGIPAEVVPVLRGRRGAEAPTFCFARTGAYEIAVAGRKLVGSAQRRQAGAFLQHGSLLLDADPERLRAVFPGLGEPLREMTTVAAALGRRVGFEEAVSCLTLGVGETLGELARGDLTPVEARLVTRLVADKYATDAWTWRAEAPAAGRIPSPSPC